jgi:sugar/nucleoside kinase (ribokinase family)
VEFVAVGEVLVDVTAPDLVPGSVVHAPVAIRPGGTPINAAFAAAALGAHATVVGRVGDDFAGAAIRDALAAAGIEALLAVDPAEPTGVFVEAGGGIVTGRGASANLSPGDIPDPLAADAVLVSGYSAAAPARVDARWYGATGPLPAPGANVAVVSSAEAAGVPEEAVRELAARHEIACVTLGAAGAIAASADRVARTAPESPAPEEWTGAGDAFAAAFLVALARGAALDEALDAAVRFASRG